MLEPLAATVLTSILPVRPLSSKTVFGMAVRSATQTQHAFPLDFFTPHPRRVDSKGKGRALPEDEDERCGGSVHGLWIVGHEGMTGECPNTFLKSSAEMTLCRVSQWGRPPS